MTSTPPPQSPAPPSPDPERPDPRSPDDAVIDALLIQTAPGASARLNQQVDWALARTFDDPPKPATAGVARPAPRPITRRRILSAFAAAAALVILVVGAAMMMPTNAAAATRATLARAVAIAAQARALAYSLQVEREMITGRRLTLHGEATFVGDGRFLIALEGPLGGTIRLGSDGRNLWVAPPFGPIGVGSRASADSLRRFQIDHPEDWQIRATLDRLAAGYALSQKTLPDGGVELTAVAEGAGPALRAERVTLVLNAERTTILSITQSWGPATSISLSYLRDAAPDEKVFSHETYSEGRPVIRRDD